MRSKVPTTFVSNVLAIIASASFPRKRTPRKKMGIQGTLPATGDLLSLWPANPSRIAINM